MPASFHTKRFEQLPQLFLLYLLAFLFFFVFFLFVHQYFFLIDDDTFFLFHLIVTLAGARFSECRLQRAGPRTTRTTSDIYWGRPRSEEGSSNSTETFQPEAGHSPCGDGGDVSTETGRFSHNTTSWFWTLWDWRWPGVCTKCHNPSVSLWCCWAGL